MLENKIKQIVTHIKDRITVFGENGFYIDHFSEYENGINGVTDTLDTYFFIQQRKRSTPDEYVLMRLKSNDEYQVISQYVLVAGLGCVSKSQVMQSLSNALVCNQYLSVNILSASFNSELIYESLYGQKLTGTKQNLVMITFEVSDMFVTTEYCDIDFCEDCCARDASTCWCGCFTN